MPTDPISPASIARARPRPLSELRATLANATQDEEFSRLIEELVDDTRAGARQVADRARRQLITRAAERNRLADLLLLRDELVAEGVRGVAGVDEVGVGPLAGPVVAAAVVLPQDVELIGLDDSKKVPRARRERLAAEIHSIALGVGIGEVSPEEIDQRGVYQAGLEAMRRAVASLSRVTEVGHLLVDARTVPGVDLPQTPIVKGDAKDASIAAASIVAKVHRDAHMHVLGARYPAYGFERHMGYGTEDHMAALRLHGPCPVHRRSFAPVAEAESRHARAANTDARFASGSPSA